MDKPRVTVEKGKSVNWLLPTFLIFVAILGVAAYVLLNLPVNVQTFEITNFVGKTEMYSNAKRAWGPLERGASFGVGDKIRTGEESEVDLKLEDQAVLRLKPNSEIRGMRPWFFEKPTVLPIELVKGTLLGAQDKQFQEKFGSFDIATPLIVATAKGTLFQMTTEEANNRSFAGVIRGALEVRKRTFFNISASSLHIGNTQKADVLNPENIKAEKIDREDWNSMKETYDLIQRSAAFEAKQIDLSKKSGTFFEYVFDHGTFFTDKFGFANREFAENPKDNEVYCEIEYDVFPVGSVVGVYIKTRGLDLSQFKGLQFEARKNPDEKATPDGFRIELKQKSQTVRATSPKVFKNEWQPYQFIFNARKPTPVNEMVFVFSHEQVGEFKKGMIQLRNFNMLPLDPEEIARREAEKEELKIEKVITNITDNVSAAKAPYGYAPKKSEATEPPKKKLSIDELLENL